MTEALTVDWLERQTGYASFYEAISSARRSSDAQAIRYCLEVVRPMVSGVASQYMRFAEQKNLTMLVSREDLEQVAFEHIIRSIERFEPPGESSVDDLACLKAWNRYTSLVVRSPVREAYAQALSQVRMPDWALKVASRLNRAIRDYERDVMEAKLSDDPAAFLSSQPDPREIAARAGVSYSQVKRFIDNGLHLLASKRFSQMTPETFEHIGPDGVDHSSSPELQLTECQERLLAEGMQLLNSRQQYVISRLYGLDGKPGTYGSVGRALKLDAEHVQALERAAMAQLKAAFMEDDQE